MVWFTGTSTGDRYNVGQSYESAGRVYTAQADGSFSVNGSNRSVVGSSQDPTTVWGGWSTPAVGPGAASYDGTASPSYGGGASAGQVYSSPSGASTVHTTGPGNAAAQNDAAGGAPLRTSGPGGGRSVVFIDPDRDAMMPKDQPLKRTGDGGPQESWGAVSDIGWMHGSNGAYVVTYSDDAKQRTEDDLLQQTQWWMRNVGLPAFMITPQPFPEFLDPDYTRWDALASGWRPGINPRVDKDGRVIVTGGGF